MMETKKRLIERIEDQLSSSDLLCAILKGLSISIASVAFLFAIVASIFVFTNSTWWVIGAILGAILGGTLSGVGLYLCDNY